MKTVGRLLGSLGVVWLAACSGSNSTLLSTVGDGGVGVSSSVTGVATHSSVATTSAGVTTVATTGVTPTVSTSSAMTTSSVVVTTTSVMTTSATTTSSSSSTPPTVVCGNMNCSAPTPVCCIGGGVGTARTCVATTGDCNGGVTRVCDGVDNCPNRQVCCPANNGATACQNGCGGNPQVCQTNNDCTGSMVNGTATPFCQTTAGNGLMNRCVECTVATAADAAQGCAGAQRCIAGRCN
jgi:hypothetical protein